ncbi:MAG: TetR/AcrR family transcriptional regulator [Chloroflexi bacterium]|jgi:AcrR family transcriptional regulator|nr:TetR/AcrR family transcriptional regulator [Chloroflexota bacterium]
MAGKKPDTPFLVEQKRERIMNAALAVFARKGYGETTVPDVAHEAGVAVGTIYNYFESKRELLISLMKERFFTASLVNLLEDTSQKDDMAFLSAFMENRLRFGFDNIDSFMFLFSEVNRDPEVRKQWVEQILKPIMARVESFIESRMAAGDFKINDPAVLARAMTGMGIGFILLYSLEREGSPIDASKPGDISLVLAELLHKGLKGGEHESG